MASFFPSSPNVNDVYTAPNGYAYQFTTKGVWKIIQAPNAAGIKFTASPSEPLTPALGDQWYDTINKSLRSYASDGDTYFWETIGTAPYVGSGEPTVRTPGMLWYNNITKELFYWIVEDGEGSWKLLYSDARNSADIILTRYVPASLAYSDEGSTFEFFTTNENFKWRSVDPVLVTEAIAGNQSITIANTAGFKSNGSYVIEDESGNFLTQIQVESVLSTTTLRVREPLTVNLQAGNKARIASTSMQVFYGYAVVSDKDVFYSKELNILRNWSKGKVIIRRSATGQGIFKVQYRPVNTETWLTLDLTATQPVFEDNNARDEIYNIDYKGNLHLRFEYNSGPDVIDTVYHFGIATATVSLENSRIETPYNVSPANQETGLSATPTLKGSPYRSLYAIEQGGAEFRLALDENMSNLVYSTSSDFLASWQPITGQTATFYDMTFFDQMTGIIVGANAIRLTNDGGKTLTTVASTANIRGVAFNGGTPGNTIIVGEAGYIAYSANRGSTWTTAAAAGGFTGILHSVATQDQIAVAVGESGNISRSINGGVIWTSIPPASGFNGTFYDVTMDSTGNLIAVGSGGNIHTSNNFGQNWMKRAQADSFTGDFRSVAIAGNRSIAVGANGTIQTSTDYGATWTKRTAAGGFTGTFISVTLRGTNAVAVGTGGEIQTSYDSGATWTKRTAAGGITSQLNAVYITNTTDTYALLAGANGVLQNTMLLVGATTEVTIPSGPDLLQTNMVYYWQVRYKDIVGYWSEFSKPTIFATKSNFNSVKQTVNLTPANNANGISTLPQLQTGAFGFLGADDTHSKTQWQVSASSSFDVPFYDSNDSDDLLSHTLPETSRLNNNTRYWWRARHKGTIDGGKYGPYSEPTSFVAVAMPNKPAMTSPTNGATGVSLTPTLTCSAFSINAPGVSHLSTQWQIATDQGFMTIIVNSGESTALTQYPIPANILNAGSTYFARVRHRGVGTDWGPFSDVVRFVCTSVGVNKPTVGVASVTTSTAALSTSNFGITGAGASDSHHATDWEVRTAPGGGGTVVFSSYGNLTSKLAISASGLPANTSLYARARHLGAKYGYSAWSDDRSFQTSAPIGEQVFTSVGVHQFIVPQGVTSVSAVCIGGGGARVARGGGGGGALTWVNNWQVSPGQAITVVVGGQSGASSFAGGITAGGGGNSTSYQSTMVVRTGGRGDSQTITYTVYQGGAGGTPAGGNGNAGGKGGNSSSYGDTYYGGGGGAAGYTGKGGDAGQTNSAAGASGSGGAGGGGRTGGGFCGGGGGVGVYGQGGNGTGHNDYGAPSGGSGGGNGQDNGGGGFYGGGASGRAGNGASGAVRIIWGPGRSYPSAAN